MKRILLITVLLIVAQSYVYSQQLSITPELEVKSGMYFVDKELLSIISQNKVNRRDSISFLHYYLKTKIESASQNISGVFKLGLSSFGSKPDDDNTWGLNSFNGIFGTDLQIKLLEGYMELKDINIISSVKIGIQPLDFALKTKGQSMLLGTSNSEPAFMSSFTKSFKGTLYKNQQISGVDYSNPQIYFGSMEGEIGGIRTTFKPYENNYLDVFFLSSVPLTDSNNENIMGLNYDFLFKLFNNKGSLLNFIITDFSSGKSNIITYGFGCDLFLPKKFEYYLEAYKQTGRFTQIGGQNVSQDANAFRSGLAWSTGNRINFKIDLSYWQVSGDNNITQSKNIDFVSYESISDAIIIENNFYGLDIDSNYGGFKLKTDMKLIYGKENFRRAGMKFLFMPAYLYKKENTYNLTTGTKTGEINKKLGNEIDFTLYMGIKENINMDLSYAILWDAKYFREKLPQFSGDNEMHLILTRFTIEF